MSKKAHTLAQNCLIHVQNAPTLLQFLLHKHYIDAHTGPRESIYMAISVLVDAVRSNRAPAYNSVVLDVDSTITGIEGIDWLAARRGEVTARAVASLTEDAMRGLLPLEHVYAHRIAHVRPRREELDLLAKAYVEALAPGAIEAVRRMRMAGVQVVLVSSALRHSLLRLALRLGLGPGDVFAVDVKFDALGAYESFDADSPLVSASGKRRVVASLPLDRPILAVGDAATDLAMRDAVDSFVAFTGFVRRDSIARQADAEITSFDELVTMVLG